MALRSAEPLWLSKPGVTKSLVFCFDRCCYDALRLLCLKQDRKLCSFA